MTNEVDDPASEGDPGQPTSSRRGHRVHFLTVVLVALAVVLLIEVVAPLHSLPAPRQIPWWILIPLFCAAEVFVVHIQFRRDAHSFSLSERPSTSPTSRSPTASPRCCSCASSTTTTH